MEPLRRQYPKLLKKLEDQLLREQSTEELAALDNQFMREIIKVRPSMLTKEEIDTRIEIVALRIGKVFRKIRGFPKCQ